MWSGLVSANHRHLGTRGLLNAVSGRLNSVHIGAFREHGSQVFDLRMCLCIQVPFLSRSKMRPAIATSLAEGCYRESHRPA